MIITCPSCAAKFTLPDGALGSEGRKVKCAKCAHVWQAKAEGAASSFSIDEGYDDSPFAQDEPDFPEPAFAPPPPPPPRPSPARPNPPRPAAAPSAPVFDAAPPRLGKQDGLPLEMDPEPPSRIPAHDDAALDEDLAKLDSILGTLKGGGVLKDKARGAPEIAGDDFADDDHLHDFLQTRVLGEDDDLEDLDGFMAAGEPEAIPRVFTGPRPSGRRRGATALKVVVMTLVALWLLALGGWFLRDPLVALVPGLAPVYTALGIDVTDPRSEVIFQNVVSTLETRDETRLLVVRGLLFNPSDENREVPRLRLTVIDDSQKVLQQVTAAPPQSVLAPGAQIPFEVSMENPSQLATGFRVVFDKAG